MGRRRPQVLPHGEDRTTCAQQVVHRFQQLFIRLAQPDHQAALDRSPGTGKVLQHPQAYTVTGARTHPGSQPRHRLQVMPDNIGACAKYNIQQIRAAAEVGDQQFYGSIGITTAHRFDDLRPMGHSAVGQVVARD